MKLMALIKTLIVIALLLCLGAACVHILLENSQRVDVNTLLGSFVAVELGTVLLICLLGGFVLGFCAGLLVCGASYFKVKRLERRIERLQVNSADQADKKVAV